MIDVTGSLAFYFDKSEQPPIDDQDDNEDHANSYMEPDDVHHGCWDKIADLNSGV